MHTIQRTAHRCANIFHAQLGTRSAILAVCHMDDPAHMQGMSVGPAWQSLPVFVHPANITCFILSTTRYAACPIMELSDSLLPCPELAATLRHSAIIGSCCSSTELCRLSLVVVAAPHHTWATSPQVKVVCLCNRSCRSLMSNTSSVGFCAGQAAGQEHNCWQDIVTVSSLCLWVFKNVFVTRTNFDCACAVD